MASPVSLLGVAIQSCTTQNSEIASEMTGNRRNIARMTVEIIKLVFSSNDIVDTPDTQANELGDSCIRILFHCPMAVIIITA